MRLQHAIAAASIESCYLLAKSVTQVVGATDDRWLYSQARSKPAATALFIRTRHLRAGRKISRSKK